MNKKAATVIESKYKKVIEAQKEEKEGRYVSIKTLDKSNYQQQLKYHMEKSKAAT